MSNSCCIKTAEKAYVALFGVPGGSMVSCTHTCVITHIHIGIDIYTSGGCLGNSIRSSKRLHIFYKEDDSGI